MFRIVAFVADDSNKFDSVSGILATLNRDRIEKVVYLPKSILEPLAKQGLISVIGWDWEKSCYKLEPQSQFMMYASRTAKDKVANATTLDDLMKCVRTVSSKQLEGFLDYKALITLDNGNLCIFKQDTIL
ncbi:hypothetical protein [Acetivibrio ethanolgignens]|uniref:Uncharacterized protein n=1 Tax=Acetivibrio ethanolgignens TaxID=290052 RepID=A0A0V8QDW1_9FIRM|nr:hypothetical protein [Acetivibrio ethanolgignens]KSV58249.1 hypothetical protein ASU35_13380 [Acetivibrio ethanolgignens]